MKTSFQLSLYVATFLSTVVYAWILLFQVVIMPGLGNLDDGAYLQSFQAIDGVIQNNQPIFVLTWVGSTFATFVCNGLALAQLGSHYWKRDKIFLTTSSILSLLIQVITASQNVPLNNRIQTLDIDNMSSEDLATERANFEDPWIFWNAFRGVLGLVLSLYLLSLVLRIEPMDASDDGNKEPVVTGNNQRKEVLLASVGGPNYQSTNFMV